MAERRIGGRPASPGIAIGPLVLWRPLRRPQPSVPGGASGELERFEAACETVGGDLLLLVGRDDRLAAEILDFQREFLTDPEFRGAVREVIGRGRSAACAVREVLDGHAAAFRAEEDPYFRARSEDLVDLRDQLLAALEGGADRPPPLPERAILLAPELTPSRFLGLDRERLGAVALEAGSPSSHVAMLARARGVPLVVELGPVETGARLAALDGERGELFLEPEPETRRRLERRRDRIAAERAILRTPPPDGFRTADGSRVEIRINVDDPGALEEDVVRASDGAGLVRTEFLFADRPSPPDEERQYRVYRDLLLRFAGKPVRFRTLDVGGDKPIAGITVAREANPFLGLRGIRLGLAHPPLLETQLRALLRAARHGPLEIMLPMVTLPAELEEVRRMVARLREELAAAGEAAPRPPLGMMVEVPAAALTLDRFAADFFSVGSNDLVQYLMAAARDGSGPVAELLDPLHPAVLRLLAEIVEVGRRRGVPVSLCGEMAGDPAALERLLALGLRSVSVAPAALARAAAAVGRFGAGADAAQP